MPDAEETKPPDEQETEKDQRCPVEMHDGEPCGRPIYNAPAGVDMTPVCLMHSSDPNKDDAKFQAEFERILQVAGEGTADFTKFVFPSVNYNSREFRAECLFEHATFTQAANFGGAMFTQKAYFRESTFTQAAEFSQATFTQAADFGGATFTQAAYFTGAKFRQAAYFHGATFTQAADFGGATFTQAAYFTAAKFTQEADFSGASFAGPARFTNAAFRYLANFSTAEFKGAALFMEASFDDDASFWLTEFAHLADFYHARFAGAAEFRETRISDGASSDPAPVFVLAQFEKPECILFYKTYLGRALFHNCDVSRFHFSNVRWRKNPTSHKNIVYEEVVNAQEHPAAALRMGDDSPDERNFVLIAELYQQLKKNYDDRRDYWTAGDFHYGEMEMKRKATPQPNFVSRWLKKKGLVGRRYDLFRRDCHQHMGLAAWYKCWSEYGESYHRPFLWLLGVLLFFALLFPLLGLRPTLKAGGAQAAAHEPVSRDAGVQELSYRNFIRYGSLQPGGKVLSYAALLGHSLMTSVGVAALQRDLAYEPSYPWGRLFALLELLLTSTLIALFLLAVRRQFRR